MIKSVDCRLPDLLLTSCVILGKLLNLSEPPFPHLSNEHYNCTYHTGLLQLLKETLCIKQLAWGSVRIMKTCRQEVQDVKNHCCL